MITYQEKLEDIRLYDEIIAIIEVCIKHYKKNADEGILGHIERLYNWSQEIRTRIDTFDYSSCPHIRNATLDFHQ